MVKHYDIISGVQRLNDQKEGSMKLSKFQENHIKEVYLNSPSRIDFIYKNRIHHSILEISGMYIVQRYYAPIDYIIKLPKLRAFHLYSSNEI